MEQPDPSIHICLGCPLDFCIEKEVEDNPYWWRSLGQGEVVQVKKTMDAKTKTRRAMPVGISFEKVPNNLRMPGQYIEINNSGAVTDLRCILLKGAKSQHTAAIDLPVL